MTWTFDIMLEKKKESKKRVIFSSICCMNKLLCNTNENFHEIATKKFALEKVSRDFHEKVARVPKALKLFETISRVLIKWKTSP